jgi:hypothetical protein
MNEMMKRPEITTQPEVSQPPQQLTSTPTMRYSPFPFEKASVYVGIDQFDYFLSMLEDWLQYHMEDRYRERFWQAIRKNCPELIQVIESDRMEIKSVVFTWELLSRAFDTEKDRRS